MTTASTPAARVTLRQPFSRAGFVDGAWWPRSHDLVAELPGLLGALAAAGHQTARVSYNLATWAEAPRRIDVRGRKVRLGGFRTSDPLAVSAVDSSGRRHIDLMIIAPDTDAATADRALQLAGVADSSARAGEIMAHASAGPAGGPSR
jgi:hypothetical protein